MQFEAEDWLWFDQIGQKQKEGVQLRMWTQIFLHRATVISCHLPDHHWFKRTEEREQPTWHKCIRFSTRVEREGKGSLLKICNKSLYIDNFFWTLSVPCMEFRLLHRGQVTSAWTVQTIPTGVCQVLVLAYHDQSCQPSTRFESYKGLCVQGGGRLVVVGFFSVIPGF